MSSETVLLKFEGDSGELLPRYREGVRRWVDAGGASPETVSVSAGEDGLLVFLSWSAEVGHEPFGRHMLGSIKELGLPFPRVDHGAQVASSWPELAAR
jgi:hypothetical protein